MKKIYSEPTIIVSSFNDEDIVTGSGIGTRSSKTSGELADEGYEVKRISFSEFVF